MTHSALNFWCFFLWVFDTLHIILCTIAVFWYLAFNFNNPGQLAFTHWSIDLQGDCEGVVGLTVELFFALRVWKVSKNIFLTGFVAALSCLHFLLGIYFTTQAFSLREFSQFSQLDWVTIAGLGGAAVADLTIAGTLVFFLNRSRTGYKRTDSIINTLMIYSIKTGLLTSIFATATVIFFVAMPNAFVYDVFFFCLGRLYVNSLLASLNSRQTMRDKASVSDSTLVQLSNLKPGASMTSMRRLSQGAPAGHRHTVSITVETTKEQKSDYFSPQPFPIDEENGLAS